MALVVPFLLYFALICGEAVSQQLFCSNCGDKPLQWKNFPKKAKVKCAITNATCECKTRQCAKGFRVTVSYCSVTPAAQKELQEWSKMCRQLKCTYLQVGVRGSRAWYPLFVSGYLLPGILKTPKGSLRVKKRVSLGEFCDQLGDRGGQYRLREGAPKKISKKVSPKTNSRAPRKGTSGRRKATGRQRTTTRRVPVGGKRQTTRRRRLPSSRKVAGRHRVSKGRPVSKKSAAHARRTSKANKPSRKSQKSSKSAHKVSKSASGQRSPKRTTRSHPDGSKRTIRHRARNRQTKRTGQRRNSNPRKDIKRKSTAEFAMRTSKKNAHKKAKSSKTTRRRHAKQSTRSRQGSKRKCPGKGHRRCDDALLNIPLEPCSMNVTRNLFCTNCSGREDDYANPSVPTTINALLTTMQCVCQQQRQPGTNLSHTCDSYQEFEMVIFDVTPFHSTSDIQTWQRSCRAVGCNDPQIGDPGDKWYILHHQRKLYPGSSHLPTVDYSIRKSVPYEMSKASFCSNVNPGLGYEEKTQSCEATGTTARNTLTVSPTMELGVAVFCSECEHNFVEPGIENFNGCARRQIVCQCGSTECQSVPYTCMRVCDVTESERTNPRLQEFVEHCRIKECNYTQVEQERNNSNWILFYQNQNIMPGTVRNVGTQVERDFYREMTAQEYCTLTHPLGTYNLVDTKRQQCIFTPQRLAPRRLTQFLACSFCSDLENPKKIKRPQTLIAVWCHTLSFKCVCRTDQCLRGASLDLPVCRSPTPERIERLKSICMSENCAGIQATGYKNDAELYPLMWLYKIHRGVVRTHNVSFEFSQEQSDARIYCNEIISYHIPGGRGTTTRANVISTTSTSNITTQNLPRRVQRVACFGRPEDIADSNKAVWEDPAEGEWGVRRIRLASKLERTFCLVISPRTYDRLYAKCVGGYRQLNRSILLAIDDADTLWNIHVKGVGVANLSDARAFRKLDTTQLMCFASKDGVDAKCYAQMPRGAPNTRVTVYGIRRDKVFENERMRFFVIPASASRDIRAICAAALPRPAVSDPVASDPDAPDGLYGFWNLEENSPVQTRRRPIRSADLSDEVWKWKDDEKHLWTGASNRNKRQQIGFCPRYFGAVPSMAENETVVFENNEKL